MSFVFKWKAQKHQLIYLKVFFKSIEEKKEFEKNKIEDDDPKKKIFYELEKKIEDFEFEIENNQNKINEIKKIFEKVSPRLIVKL